MKIVKTAKLSSRGQIVIPQKIRDILGLEAEDEMAMTVDGDRVIMKKLDLGDILNEATEARKKGETISHTEMKKRYGV